MTKELLHEWLDESPERSRVFIEEGLILEATEAICEALEKHGMSRANLADQLGKNKTYVTQLLDGSRNMTLRTFASIAYALDMVPKIELGENSSDLVAPSVPFHPKSENETTDAKGKQASF